MRMRTRVGPLRSAAREGDGRAMQGLMVGELLSSWTGVSLSVLGLAVIPACGGETTRGVDAALPSDGAVDAVGSCSVMTNCIGKKVGDRCCPNGMFCAGGFGGCDAKYHCVDGALVDVGMVGPSCSDASSD
jgi:hypothetical protein